MNWHEFIFSKKPSVKLKRHLAFWCWWWLYFATSYFHNQQTGLQSIALPAWDAPFFLKMLALLVMHAIACYTFLIFLLPQAFSRPWHPSLALGCIMLILLLVQASYLIHESLFPSIDRAFNQRPKPNIHLWWTSISSGLLSAPKVIASAIAIVMLKRWWYKMMEKEALEKDKLKADLKLLKSQMHPGFMLSALNAIKHLTQKKERERAATLLLKLADILSYMLYECDKALVPLEKEIKIIKDYLVIEQAIKGKRLEIDISIKGETGLALLVPLTLFTLIENCFACMDYRRQKRNWINLEIIYNAENLTMKLIHGKTSDPSMARAITIAMASAERRLTFYYPEQFELRNTVEPEMMMTYLKVTLAPQAVVNEIHTIPPEEMAYATG